MTNSIATELKKNDDKSFVLNLTIAAATISSTYQQVTLQAAQEVEVKGFRKGKAPLDVIEQHLSAEKILEETAQKLIPELYAQKVKEYELKPIVQPQIKITNPPITKDKDWQIEITSCELPDLSLSAYEVEIKKINQEKGDDKEKHVNQILDTLLKSAKVTLPQILIQAEVNYKLSRLVDQTNQAGISVQTYLKNQNTTLENYQKNLEEQTTKEWTLNLAIDQIARDQKIEVSPVELETELKKYPAEKVDQNFLNFVLLQNKTLNYLQTL